MGIETKIELSFEGKVIDEKEYTQQLRDKLNQLYESRTGHNAKQIAIDFLEDLVIYRHVEKLYMMKHSNLFREIEPKMLVGIPIDANEIAAYSRHKVLSLTNTLINVNSRNYVSEEDKIFIENERSKYINYWIQNVSARKTKKKIQEEIYQGFDLIAHIVRQYEFDSGDEIPEEKKPIAAKPKKIRPRTYINLLNKGKFQKFESKITSLEEDDRKDLIDVIKEKCEEKMNRFLQYQVSKLVRIFRNCQYDNDKRLEAIKATSSAYHNFDLANEPKAFLHLKNFGRKEDLLEHNFCVRANKRKLVIDRPFKKRKISQTKTQQKR